VRTSPFARVVRSFCIAAALGILLVASSTPAGATGTLDQSQEAQTELNGVPLVGSQFAAQTFTAGRQGALDQVDLLLTRYETPGNLTIEIRTADAGVPTSEVIASGAVVDTSLDADPYTYEWVSVALSPAAVVSIGTQYAIVVRDTGAAIFPTDYFVWAEADSDPYANGMAITSGDGGATWFLNTSIDFAFRTYVGTAGATACLAKDGSVSNSNLQTIIDGANTGDTIVITGTCVGNFSIPGGGSASSLTLVGKGTPIATLDGDHSGTVVHVGPSETVTFKNLLITNGAADTGGGIYNDGAIVNLSRNAQVNGNNAATFGGGIWNERGTVNLSAAQVNQNIASFAGIGIYNNYGTLNLSRNAQVNDNTGGNSGGGIYNYRGVVHLSSNVQVNDNSVAFYGGGIFSAGGSLDVATVTVSGNAQVIGNTAGQDGGGIFSISPGGTLAISGNARVNANSANRDGGGIFLGNLDTVTMSGNAQVNGNAAGDGGGGIYNTGAIVNLSRNAQVDGNRAGSNGGGIFNDFGNYIGTLTMSGKTQVNGNTALYGAGINNVGALTMSGKAQSNANTATGNGGGIYNVGTATLMGQAQVNNNTANFSGGGIFNSFAILRMSGKAQVSGNESGLEAAGGGINNSGTITMDGKTQVNGNTGGYGGGISSNGDVTMSGKAQANGNTANYQGGGIYNSVGTLTMNDAAHVDGNKAGIEGGGIYHDSGNLVGAVAGVNVKFNIPDDIAP
jgi:hypothetical protein